MAKLQLAATWRTWQDQTGGNKDGLFVRLVWGTVPAARTLGTLDRKAGPCRCGVQHVHLAASGHHLPPVYDPDLRDRLHPWSRVDGLGVHLGHHRLVARYRPLGEPATPSETRYQGEDESPTT